MDFKDIDLSKIKFTEFPKKYSKQNILYPNIDDKSVIFKTPWILLDQCGLQKKNIYFPDDSRRNFIKIPHSKTNEEFYHFLIKHKGTPPIKPNLCLIDFAHFIIICVQ